MNTEKIKQDFPILKRKINNKKLTYLDSSATSLTPSCVIEKIKEVYETYNSNVHRGVYTISEEATMAFENTRKKVANFINAKESEIIFTKNSTESLNIAAYSLIDQLVPGDEILTTEIEHHSNLVTWQQLAKKKKIKVLFAKQEENILELITPKTKIIALTHFSNVLANEINIKQIAQKAHENNIYLVVDGSQFVTHNKLNVKDLDVDLYTFSAHKMLGPFGVGILYGKKELLEKLSPFQFGGDMIKDVSLEETKFNDVPWKFEAGTPNIADVIAFGESIDYLNNIGLENINQHQKILTDYAKSKFKELNNIKIYSTGNSLISFNIFDSENKLIHPHDVSSFLDKDGISVRGGHLCAQPLMKKLNIPGVVRASFYIYNDEQDIDLLIASLIKVQEAFSKIKIPA